MLSSERSNNKNVILKGDVGMIAKWQFHDRVYECLTRPGHHRSLCTRFYAVLSSPTFFIIRIRPRTQQKQCDLIITYSWV